MKTIISALLLVCMSAAAFWAFLDRPLHAPNWQDKVMGISYNPSHLFRSVAKTDPVALREIIRGDLRHLAQYTSRVRTYSVEGALGDVPELAQGLGLKITLGIWLSDDRTLNEKEIAKAIGIIRAYPRVIDRVIVGNEVVLRGELTAPQVTNYIKRVRAAVANPNIEIGTAEVWGVWLEHRDLAVASDFIGAHLLPYWEGISYQDSMAYIDRSVGILARAFPNKPIVIAEAGWPSEGRVKKGSEPSPSMEAFFIRNFVAKAAAKSYDYYLIEAYDQPWKAEQEGAVGAYWGLFDADRGAKFAFSGALTSFPQWQNYSSAAAVATLLLGCAVFSWLPRLRFKGYLMVGLVAALVVTGGLMVFQSSSLRYADWTILGGAVVVLPALAFTMILLITETAEWALSLWRVRRREAAPNQLIEEPMVSIHVPCYNEPPEMVIETLRALSRLDYDNYEVILLDNNTKDEAVWRPVERFCSTLGPKFRFFHFDGVKGFKAGALNKALELTNPKAKFVALIDSDYQVQPHWLLTAMPHFRNPKVALVQAPQDYRDASETDFKRDCYEEYRAFFHVGMVERDEHDAIVQHGTMCIMRRSALDKVGRWGEWCITEDTELGLRLFEAGYSAHFIRASLGQGLMPDTFSAYKAQRHRWVYGAMQMLKRHAGALFGGRSKLTTAQRYHFIAGWLPWFADAFALVFGAFALVWTALMMIAPRIFDVPLTVLSASSLALFAIKTAKAVSLHRSVVGTSYKRAVGAAVSGLALAYVVGSAVISGLFTSGRPFARTPKCEGQAAWIQGLRMVRTEALLLLASIGAVVAMLVKGVDDPAEIAWTLALLVSMVPHAAALKVSLNSTRPIVTAPVVLPTTRPTVVAPTARADLDLAA